MLRIICRLVFWREKQQKEVALISWDAREKKNMMTASWQSPFVLLAFFFFLFSFFVLCIPSLVDRVDV